MRREKEKMKPAGIWHLMLFIILTSGLDAAPPPGPDEELAYYNQWSALDYSAVKTCRILNGQIQAVTTANLDKGYYCDYKASVWTGDQKQALEFCKSNTAYHIRLAEPFDDGGFAKTHCQFHINLKCSPDYFQIFNTCYKRVLGKFTYDEAKAHCENDQPKMGSTLAQYYSDLLSVYFEDMFIGAAWLDVDDMGHYYDLKKEEENATGIFVQDDAWKFHVKPGTILMMEKSAKYEALCQYKPGNTMAEMFYMAEVYQPVYKIIITDEEAIMVSPGYMSIDANRTTTSVHNNKLLQKFSVYSMGDACNRMSRILGVESFPVGHVEQMYNAIKDQLTDHRFFMTAAWKNDGCSVKEYRYVNWETGEEMPAVRDVLSAEKSERNKYCNAFSYSFSKMDQFPTMAAMRAPIMCSFTRFKEENDPCLPGWIQFERTKDVRACHWVSTQHLGNVGFEYPHAIEECRKKNALLGGFENIDELNVVWKVVRETGFMETYNPVYQHMRNHNWLSGQIPCVGDCASTDMAGWTEQVSRNNFFLNNHDHEGWTWSNADNNKAISLRGQGGEFHTHNLVDPYKYMYFICTKYATVKKILVQSNKMINP